MKNPEIASVEEMKKLWEFTMRNRGHFDFSTPESYMAYIKAFREVTGLDKLKKDKEGAAK